MGSRNVSVRYPGMRQEVSRGGQEVPRNVSVWYPGMCQEVSGGTQKCVSMVPRNASGGVRRGVRRYPRMRQHGSQEVSGVREVSIS